MTSFMNIGTPLADILIPDIPLPGPIPDIPTPDIPTPKLPDVVPDVPGANDVVNVVFHGIAKLLAQAIVELFGYVIGWFDQVTELDLTAPWVTESYGKMVMLGASFATLLLIITSVTGGARRGVLGALSPVGRLMIGCIWFGFMRVMTIPLWDLSNKFTEYLAPDIKKDIQTIIATLTEKSFFDHTSIVLLFILLLIMFVAAVVIAFQFLLQHYLVLALYLAAPVVGIVSIVDKGLDLIRRFSYLMIVVILCRPLIAFCIHIAAQPLQTGSHATFVDTAGGAAALSVAAVAPFKIISLAFLGLGAVVASASRSSTPQHVTSRVSAKTAEVAAAKHHVSLALASNSSHVSQMQNSWGNGSRIPDTSSGSPIDNMQNFESQQLKAAREAALRARNFVVNPQDNPSSSSTRKNS